MKNCVVICQEHDCLPSTAICEGVSRLGYEVTKYDHWQTGGLPEADLVCIHGLRGQGQDILDHYKEAGTPLIAFDHGFIDRVFTQDDYATGYWYVGLGGLGWSPDGVDGSRAKRLIYDIKPRREGPIKRVLITGQVAYDSSHRMGHAELSKEYVRMKDWLETKGVQVSFRGHPQCPEVNPGIRQDGIRTLSEALEDYDLVCTINSNSGLDAVMAGLPVMITKPCHYQSVAYPFGFDLAKIKPPTESMVQRLIERLSWSQWRALEIAEGLPFQFLRERGLIV